MTPAGWYHVETDPPGTVRYWDGHTWIGEPQLPVSETIPPAPLASPSTTQQKLSPFAYWWKCWTRSMLDYSGRARRAEFGWFVLINGLISLAIFIPSLIPILTSEFDPITGEESIPSWAWIGLLVYLAFSLIQLIPFFAVSARRFHDVGSSGWLAVLYVPAVLMSIMVVLLVLIQTLSDSTPEPNEWGASPKYG